MQIDDVIWLEQVVEKIESKHHISLEEVEEVLSNRPKYRNAQKGRIHGEDLYYAYGQTDSGRSVFIVFIWFFDNSRNEEC
ncbi:MAG: BrnT family toxin [bacterium]|nr:BrnT family toxin [bacterium]